MRNPISDLQSSATRVDTVTVSKPKTQRAVYQCLIVSCSDDRNEMLVRSAGEVGWDLIVCHDAERAARQAARERVHLAIIDLVNSGTGPPPGFRKLSETLAARDGPLLLICGQEGDALEEIWARQLGVWLYLPGVNQSSDIATLCEKARTVVDKLHARKSPRQPTRNERARQRQR